MPIRAGCTGWKYSYRTPARRFETARGRTADWQRAPKSGVAKLDDRGGLLVGPINLFRPCIDSMLRRSTGTLGHQHYAAQRLTTRATSCAWRPETSLFSSTEKVAS